MTVNRDTLGNVAQMLWDAADRQPDRPAVVEPARRANYGELRDRASAIAARLTADGVGPGDRVVVLQERGIDAVASFFGVLATGALAVVLNPLWRPRQVEYVLAQCEARALLTSDAVRRRVHRDIQTHAVPILVDDIGPTTPWHPAAVRASEPAQITYTSGSTGLPKGVVASHANVWSVISTVADYLGIRADDRIAGILPVSGVYGANQMLCSVYRQATLVVPLSPLMNDVAEELRSAAVTVLAAVPPLWMQLLQAPRFADGAIPSLRLVQNAGGHLAPAAVHQLRQAQPQAEIFLQYGMTEVFRSTYLPPADVASRAGSMGRPMPGVEILVVAEDGSLCGPGDVGELVHAESGTGEPGLRAVPGRRR